MGAPPSLESFLLALGGCDSSCCFAVCDKERTHTADECDGGKSASRLPSRLNSGSAVISRFAPPSLLHKPGEAENPIKAETSFLKIKTNRTQEPAGFWKLQQITPWSFRNQNTLRNPALNDSSRFHRQSGQAEHWVFVLRVTCWP